MDRGSVAVVTVCDSFSVSHSLRFNGPTPNKPTDSFLNYLRSRFCLIASDCSLSGFSRSGSTLQTAPATSVGRRAYTLVDRGIVAVVTVCHSFSVSHSLRLNEPIPNKPTDSFLNYLQLRFLLNRFRLLSKRFLLL